MFTTLRKLFGRKAEPAVAAPGGFHQAPPPQRLTKPVSSPRALPATPTRVELPPRSGAPAGPVPTNMAIPLKSVLGRLPADLMQRIRQIDVGEAELFVPMQKILSQITQGTVKISFGELRQAAPPGTFTAENDRDRTLVELPLHEILSRLNPTLLARRPSQKHVVIPPEVPGPFGGQTKVVISNNPLKAPAEPAARIQAPTPPAPVTPPPAPQTQVASSQPPFRAQPFGTAPVQPPARPQPPTPATQPIPAVAARVRPVVPVVPAQPAAPVAPVAQSAPVAPAAPVKPPVPVAQPAPVRPPVAARTVSPLASQQTAEDFGFNFKRADSPAAPARPAQVVRPVAPAPAPAGELAPTPEPAPARDLAPAVPAAPIAPVAPTPFSDDVPIPCNIPLQQTVAAVAPHAAPVAAPAPVAPAAPAVPVAPPETRFLMVMLAALAESWPEPLRQEINAQRLSALSVGLPMGVIEGAIKQGKVAFPWKAIRSWIKPPMAESVSAHDATLVDLPLKVITPLFLAELKATRAQKKISLDENIPDLFSDARQSDATAPAPAPVRMPAAPAPVRTPVPVAAPVAAPVPAPVFAPAAPGHVHTAPVATPVPQEAPVFAFSAPGTPAPIAPAAPVAPAAQAQPAKTSDTNYYTQQNGEEIPGETPLVFKKPGTPGTAFLNRYATPNEIVNKAASLQGVDGALIALPDGLLVASRIPASMNADTIAAFLPQIFAKVSQCTRELRLGELNNLNFTVGNIPWKIFRVGAIYFAAFGRPGEAMPTGQLAGIAAELDRKAK